MSEQGDVFVRKYLHGDPTPTSIDQDIAYLRQLGGSERAAARLAGMHHRNFQRYRAGAQPSRASAARIAEAVREQRTGTPSDQPSFDVNRSEPGKRRRPNQSVSAAQLGLLPGTMAAARTVWVTTGDSDAAAYRWTQGIQEPWYRKRFQSHFLPEGDREAFDIHYPIYLA